MAKKNLGSYGGTKSALAAGYKGDNTGMPAPRVKKGYGNSEGEESKNSDGQTKHDFSGALGKHDEVSTPKPSFNRGVKRGQMSN